MPAMRTASVSGSDFCGWRSTFGSAFGVGGAAAAAGARFGFGFGLAAAAAGFGFGFAAVARFALGFVGAAALGVEKVFG